MFILLFSVLRVIIALNFEGVYRFSARESNAQLDALRRCRTGHDFCSPEFPVRATIDFGNFDYETGLNLSWQECNPAKAPLSN
jgi:hypothetical protein